MFRALLFATCVLLCLDLSLSERTKCYSCLMNYPGSGCVTGGKACSADLDRGQNCITLHFFHEEQELLRVQGCTRPGIDICGKEQKSGNYTIKFECCVEPEMCNRVFWESGTDYPEDSV